MTSLISQLKFKVPIIFFCVALIASEIECRYFHRAPRTNTSFYMQFSSDESNNVKLGEGAKEYYLSIFEWIEDCNTPYPSIYGVMYDTVNNQQCHFAFVSSDGYDKIQIEKVYQISNITHRLQKAICGLAITFFLANSKKIHCDWVYDFCSLYQSECFN